MKLLFLTNFYPPFGQGGYEEWCNEMALALRCRGHSVNVLTSRHQNGYTVPEAEWIHRILHLEMPFTSLRNGIDFFTKRRKREQENMHQTENLIERLAPDAILIWGMWNLSRQIAVLAERKLPGRIVFYLGDYWPTLSSQHLHYWQARPRNWLTAFPKKILGWPARFLLARTPQENITFNHALFCSEYLREELMQKGIEFGQTALVYGGVNTKIFEVQRPSQMCSQVLTLLYVGRLRHDKGVHTAIEAVGKLVDNPLVPSLRLLIAGRGEPGYEARLKHWVTQNGLEDFITFLGGQNPLEMPELYRQSDMLLCPSIWAEPFGRVLVEAMAAGLVVIGSATGGSAEILNHEHNGLRFIPEDSDDLVKQICKVVQQPELRQKLITNGQLDARQKFDTSRMAIDIEQYLTHLT